MAKCCICGSKIGRLDLDIPLTEKYHEFKLCTKCCGMKAKCSSSNLDEQTKGLQFLKSKILEGLYDISATEAIQEIIDDYENEKRRKQEELAKMEREANKAASEYREKMESFLITTTNNFEGYRIKKYIGVLSGEVVLGTGLFSDFDAALSDFFGANASAYTSKLMKAREEAISRLKLECINRNANAVIGVDIDIMTLGSNMIVVSANGTAVIIE